MAEVECDYCGDRITKPPSAISDTNFCDRQCLGNWQSENRTGEDHHQYNQITKECDYCNSNVTRRPSEFGEGGTFCNRQCAANYRSDNGINLPPTFYKEDHPQYDSVVIECHWCDEETTKQSWELDNRENIFCSIDCRSEWQSENIVGENHHQWTGGEHRRNGEGWYTNRKKALQRDGCQCVECGMNRDEHKEEFGTDIHVHHIVPFNEFEMQKEANKLENLATVCEDCHYGTYHSDGNHVTSTFNGGGNTEGPNEQTPADPVEGS